jgi:long-chain acyl-CoA synthetase
VAQSARTDPPLHRSQEASVVPPAPPTSASPYAARPWLDSYPDGVPADFDFPAVPLTRLLDDAASSFPTGTALAFLGTRLTYRELRESVDRFAAALAGLGVGKGDRVAIVLPNCPQNVIAFFATLRLGAVVVQHNPLYTDTELRHQLSDCGAKVVVCLDRVYEAVARVRRDTALEHVVVTSLADYLPRTTRLKLSLPVAKARKARAEITATLPKSAPVKQFLALLKPAGSPARQTPVDPVNDLALLQYTGGTTGLSKGAMLTHTNLVSNAYMNRLWDTGATAGKEVTLGVLPLFHAYGLTVCMNATVLLGGTLVLLPRFDLDQVFEAIDTWKPTMFPGVPPIYKALTDSPKARSHDLRSIRVCVSGAMKLPAEIQEQFERISGARLVEGYGMTETSPSTHCNPVTGARKPGSIGLPLPGTWCKIVDRNDPRREMPVGEAGELAVAGPQVFEGYWGRSDSDDVFTGDGYMLTGDIATMDEDGYFTIVDRKKELIIAGGFNIYPSEVEEVLFRLPGVADAVVIGVPDRYRGETAKAFIVRAPGARITEDDVVAHCARDLTAYKVPKLVEFREALPRTAVGKVLRRVLVDEERAKADHESQARPASVPGGRARTTASAPPAPQPPAVAEAPTEGGEDEPAAPQQAEPAVSRAARRAPAVKKAAVNGPAAKVVVGKAPVGKAPVGKAPVGKAPVGKAQKPASAKAAPATPARKPAPAKAAPAEPARVRPAATEPPAVKPAATKAARAKAAPGPAPSTSAPSTPAPSKSAAAPPSPPISGPRTVVARPNPTPPTGTTPRKSPGRPGRSPLT